MHLDNTALVKIECIYEKCVIQPNSIYNKVCVNIDSKYNDRPLSDNVAFSSFNNLHFSFKAYSAQLTFMNT